MSDLTTKVPQVTVPRYQAPTVTATLITSVISSEPLNERRWPGHYQSILLNVRTGELSFHESTQHRDPWNPDWKAINDVPREIWKRWHPGTGFSGVGPHAWFEPVPELLSWIIDSGVEELPYLDVATANDLLTELVPYAQALLNGLFDTGELDWSADAAHAGRQIRRLVTRHRSAADRTADADLVDYQTIVEQCPQVYEPELLDQPLSKLADRCESITRFLGRWHSEIKKLFGKPYSDASGIGLDVLGVRAWYRTVIMNGDPRPPMDFTDYDGPRHRLDSSEITATTTDDELDTWAKRETRQAARELGVRLLGASDAAYAYRARLREQEWDRLAVFGAEVARLERELATARATRLDSIRRAITWGRGDSAIADRAQMSKQAVNKIRKNDV